jgi:hypothetical protein
MSSTRVRAAALALVLLASMAVLAQPAAAASGPTVVVRLLSMGNLNAALSMTVNRAPSELATVNCAVSGPAGGALKTSCGNPTTTGTTTTYQVTLPHLHAGEYKYAMKVTTTDAKSALGWTTFTVAKGRPTCTVTPYHVTFNGLAHTATGSCVGASGASLPAGDLQLAPTTHTNAGTFTDGWQFTDPAGDYASQSGVVTDVIDRRSQTISFGAGPSTLTVGASYRPSATATSGLPVTFAINSASTSVCALASGVVMFNAAGLCKVDAHQPGNGSWLAAPLAQQAFTIGKRSQTITFGAGSIDLTVGASYTPTATATSGLPVTFSIDSASAGVCSLTAGIVAFDSAGGCTVDANQVGDATWSPAPLVQQTFTIVKRSQTITFGAGPASSLVGDSYTPTATATSGLPVTFSVDGVSAGICSIAAGVVSFDAAGVCTVDGNQSGNGTWSTAPLVQQTFTIVKRTQTITFGAGPVAPEIDGSYTPSATATSGLSVAFTVDDVSAGICSITAGVVSFDAVGVCTIDANQSGDGKWSAASLVQQTFTIVGHSQTITFGSAPIFPTVNGSYAPTATATSGLIVSLSIDSATTSNCSLRGIVVSFSAPGTCTVDANQAGDASWIAAPLAQQTFTILGDAVPRPAVVVNAYTDPQVPVLPPDPGTLLCSSQTIVGGGCAINSLDATIDNVFDASGTATATGPGVSVDDFDYHWQIYEPPNLGSALYTASGITGYHSPVLHIAPDSLPDLAGAPAPQDLFWRVGLTITAKYGSQLSSTVFFRFEYRVSQLTLRMSTMCQILGHLQDTLCTIENGLPATEPT